METTRRLSLTLLLVAPLITAQDSQSVDLSLGSVSGEHLPDGVRSPRPSYVEYYDQEEVGTSTTIMTMTMDSVTRTQREEGKLVRERRDGGEEEDIEQEDMEVAEQVVFRPYFRRSQILENRKLDKAEAVRKQSLEPATASGQAYYPYQYNYYYPLGSVRS